jgi:branched-chain amino acid transport system permease protein/urea transport system permease protein
MVSDIAVTLGLNTVSAILILALAALGLAIIFGLMEVVNLAHGAFFTLGGYTVWLFATRLDVSFWLGFVLAPVLVGLVGFAVERLVIRHLYHRLLDTILATWGIAIVIRELIKVLVGPDNKQVANPFTAGVDVLGVTYPAFRLFLIVFAAAVIVATFVAIQRTTFGVRLRAVIQDDENATLLGIDRDRMYAVGFSFGAACAGMAGAAVTPIISVNPNMGQTYLVQSFLAVILGGTGQLLGIIPGSSVLAGGSNLMTYSLSPVVAQTAVFVIAIVVIVVRPRGILRGKEV